LTQVCPVWHNSEMHDHIAHHIFNVAAIGAPIASFMAYGPHVLTAVLTLMGIAWYAVLFYDRFLKKKDP
jgi:hypothetical protein